MSRGNTEKKAGALNQALTALLPRLRDDELVMVMDADSMVVPNFLAVALGRLQSRSVGAIGGVFYGEPGGGLVRALQRNVYDRYAREIARRRGRAVVLTGTASVFRVDVLRAVAATRGTTLPDRPDTIYDTHALTEDNGMTLAVKTLGWTPLSPRECGVVTEVMPTWSQRLRWQRGAVENLRTYGLTRVTLPYLLKQAVCTSASLRSRCSCSPLRSSVCSAGSPYLTACGGRCRRSSSSSASGPCGGRAGEPHCPPHRSSSSSATTCSSRASSCVPRRHARGSRRDLAPPHHAPTAATAAVTLAS